MKRDCDLSVLEYILDAIEKEDDIAFDGVTFLSKKSPYYKEECKAMLVEIQQNIEKWVTPNYFQYKKIMPEEMFNRKCQECLDIHVYFVKTIQEMLHAAS